MSAGCDLIFLHGANGCGPELAPLTSLFGPQVRCWTPNLLGHGGRPVPEPSSVEAMALDVIAQMDARGVQRCFVGGYSFGGYVALFLARHFPQRFEGVCTLATKFVWDAATVARFVALASEARCGSPTYPFHAQIMQRHQPQRWQDVLGLCRQLFRDLGALPSLSWDTLAHIHVPKLVISSDQDQLVSPSETQALGQGLNALVAMFHGGQCHPLSAAPRAQIAQTIERWMADQRAAQQA